MDGGVGGGGGGGLEGWLRAAGAPSVAVAADGVRAAVGWGLTPEDAASWPEAWGALAALDELARRGEAVSGEEARWVAAVGGASPWLGREVARLPGARWALRWGGERRTAWGAERLRAAWEAHQGRWGMGLGSLRAFRQGAMARAFLREVEGLGEGGETTAEVSALAALCLEEALAWVRAGWSSRWPVDEGGAPIGFAVIGLGKLGGWELNFGSDVDLVYVYGSDQGRCPDGRLSVHEAFVKIGQALTQAMEEVAPEGRLWRVDLRLRPEGARGPLVQAAAALERYYEAWGRTFDRAVWLKARAVAGDRGLGEGVIQALAPFVYKRHLELGALDDLREMKDRIDRHARNVGARSVRLGMSASRPPQVPAGWPAGGEALLGWDIKTGDGGIREVEFSVQALQLVYGGRQASLRERSTLGALSRVLAAGLMPAADVDALGAAYALYRRVEHAVQLEEDRHTHALPASAGAFEALARRVGEASGAALAAALQEHRRAVGQIFGRLFAERQDAEAWRPPAAVQRVIDLLVVLRDGDAGQQEALRAAGFSRPRQSAGQLLVLTAKPWSPYAPSADAALRRVGTRLLAEVCRSADPDMALVHLTTFLLRVGPRRAFLDVLASSPAAMSVLITLFGSSRYFAEGFARRPELFDALLGDPAQAGRWDRARLEAEVEAELAPLREVEARMGHLRVLRHRHELRVAIGDLGGALEVEDIGVELALLADVLLTRVYAEALGELEARYGALEGEGAGFAVIGLGKLGGQELLYGSDLDLVFLYTPGGVTRGERVIQGAEFCTRLARRMIAFLSTSLGAGPLYAVDTRLRPDGQQGTLVTAWDTFEAYHRGRALEVERLALVRGRVILGTPELAARFEGLREALCFGRPEAYEGALEGVAALRSRLDGLVQPGGVELKLARGGLLDAEVLTQLAQVRWGGEVPGLRTPSTLPALRALAESGLVERGAAEGLWEAYALLRRVENRLRMVEGRGSAAMPAEDEAAMTRLALRVGYRGAEAGARLRADVEEAMAQIRALAPGGWPC